MEISFNSTSHQRFENNIPINSLQECNRCIKIEKNINGCKGYRLINGDGYIVSIINIDGNHPLWQNKYQMSPKPMRVVLQNSNIIVLRGYSVLAQTPFGWDNFDMSDYGITLYIKGDEIEKCRLDMFDRNIYIEYYK